MINVVPPSGIFNIFTILAIVPTVCRSAPSGSSILVFFCAITPISLSDLCAFLTALIDFSRPTAIGITTPGYNTLFLRGNNGITGLTFKSSSSSLSSTVNMGIISTSSPTISSIYISSNIFNIFNFI